MLITYAFTYSELESLRGLGDTGRITYMLTRVPVPEEQSKGRHTSTISAQGDECRKARRLLQGDAGLQPG